FGYKYFSSPFQDATVNEFGDEVNLASSFPFLYRYDESRTSSGWVGYTTAADPLNTLQGYAVNFGATGVPVTVDVAGSVNNGPLSVALYNNNNTYTKGFNLVGNPYPSAIDWDAAGWTKTKIDNAIYYFRASTTDEYGGTYSSYINGISTAPGEATNIIPSMQGFFVHVSNETFPVMGTLGLDNNVRVTDQTHPFLKSKEIDQRFLIRLSVSFTDDPLSSDPMVIYFDYNTDTGFESDHDALKILNTDLTVPNLYSLLSADMKLSINALPVMSDTSLLVPLGLKTNKTGELRFRISDIENMPTGMSVYLRDAVTSKNQDLLPDKDYNINLPAGEYHNRFYLGFLKSTTDITEIDSSTDILTVYASENIVKAFVRHLEGREGTILIFDLGGRLVFSRTVYETGYYELSPHVITGIYIVNYTTGNRRSTKRILISN
ncbi:MAG: T9SS type A sorting domain-containing protein, partial [Bacteroidales bacterium]|nr:T9SS type A sorting domain-containing protein [Bacteroidales bacterium]